MTTSDVQIIYEQLVALQVEVRGYRLDLNGRLRQLEQSTAARAAVEQEQEQDALKDRAKIGLLVFGTAAVAATIGSVVSIITMTM